MAALWSLASLLHLSEFATGVGAGAAGGPSGLAGVSQRPERSLIL
jgi:hypothetical protein